MTLRLTPDLLRAEYAALLQVESIGRLGLPDCDDVKFLVIKTSDRYGDYEFDGSRDLIRVSQGKVGSIRTLAETIAHECVHIAGRIQGVKDYTTHGAWFKRLAKPICRECGFDEQAF